MFRTLGLRCILAKNAVKFQRQFATSVLHDEDFNLQYLDGDDKGIAVFCMTRPAAKNSFGKNMVQQMKNALEKVQHNKDIRAVIVRSGVPGIFCAGADLKERVKMAEEDVAPFVSGLKRMVMDLADLPMPTIAALDGHALGGGLEMAMMCDLRTAADDARMGVVETRLGIMPGAGGTQRLPRLVGPAIAKDMIFTARTVTGAEAMGIGLVNYSVAQNDAGDAAYHRALKLARDILPNGPFAVKMTKLAINRGIEVDLNTALEIEKMCYAQVIPTKDRMEGLRAFNEKRKPRYTGE